MSVRIIFLITLCSFLLVSCAENETQTIVSSPLPKKVITQNPTPPVLENRGTTNITETSTGGVQYEIINGIEVPPEPDPVLNNATLAGVDVNGNGVRDDVEREIALRSGNFQDSIKIAVVYGKFLTAPQNLDRIGALALYGDLMCVSIGVPQQTYGSHANSLRDLIFNTHSRLSVLNRVNLALDGGFDGEELPQCNQ